MSYILEALKKSELEREQLAISIEADLVPGSVAPALPTHSWKASLIQRSFSTYFGMVVIVLLVFVSFTLINTTKDEIIVSADVGQPLNDVSPYQNEPMKLTEEPTQQISVTPVIAANSVQETPLVLQATAKKTTPVQESSFEQPALKKEAIEMAGFKQTIDTIDEERPVVLSIEQAGDAEREKIPNISITSHIYSSQAKRRSIVVNNERLVEGDFVSPQVQVQEITHQGMILKVNDSLLAVSRSRGWNR